MKLYNEKLRGQKDLSIDMVKLMAKGMTICRAPIKIIPQLFQLMAP